MLEQVLHVNKLALQQNRTLLRLGMQSTHLSCEGAVALAEIIADNPTIQVSKAQYVSNHFVL